MNHPPSPNGSNGDRDQAGKRSRRATQPPAQGSPRQRTAGGRFAPGNAGGPGNPYAKAIGQLRTALLGAVSEADIRAIIAALVKEAKGGNIPAARELLDRCFGRPVEADLLVRMEELEKAVREFKETQS